MSFVLCREVAVFCCSAHGCLFPNVHYIWMVRRDKVRQAVSWAKAAQTDIYARSKGEAPVPKQEPAFDFAFIDQLYKYLKIPYPKNLVFGERRLQKQADALNETWVEKYIEMKRHSNEYA